jgi:hypothetical protein
MRPEWRTQRGGRREARWRRAPPLSLAGGGKEAAGAEEGEGNGGGEEREREGAVGGRERVLTGVNKKFGSGNISNNGPGVCGALINARY